MLLLLLLFLRSCPLYSAALSLAITSSSNLTMKVLPLCQWADTCTPALYELPLVHSVHCTTPLKDTLG